MDKLDMNKLNIAIKYVSRMGEGKNPVNNTPVEDSVLNDPNVIRCMYFVKELLEEVQKNPERLFDEKKNARVRRPKQQLSPYPYEVLSQYRYRKDVLVTHMLNEVNSLAGDRSFKKVSAGIITKWLRSEGYIEKVYDPDLGKEVTNTTEAGQRFGLYTILREYPNGDTVRLVMYSERAQEYIVSNLQRIIETDGKEIHEL